VTSHVRDVISFFDVHRRRLADSASRDNAASAAATILRPQRRLSIDISVILHALHLVSVLFFYRATAQQHWRAIVLGLDCQRKTYTMPS